MGSEHDFTGKLEDWEDRVFQNATVFRLHSFDQDNKRKGLDTPSFATAMYYADEEFKAGNRVLVYAIAPSERWFCIPRERFGYYATMWINMRK